MPISEEDLKKIVTEVVKSLGAQPEAGGSGEGPVFGTVDAAVAAAKRAQPGDVIVVGGESPAAMLDSYGALVVVPGERQQGLDVFGVAAENILSELPRLESELRVGGANLQEALARPRAAARASRRACRCWTS